MSEEKNHEPLPVHGYKSQGEANVARVNVNTELEERVLRRLDELAKIAVIHGTVDPRWLAIGRTAIEQGFMAVNRAIFQPARVALPEDPKPEAPKS